MTGKPQKRPQSPQRATAGAPTQGTGGGRPPVILVPLDGSVEAKTALPAARLVARIAQASIHVVHVADRPLSQEELLQRMSLQLEETHGLVIDQALGVPADAVVRLAEEQRAILIAMTTRGRTAYLGRIVRPVVEQIVQKASCPVLLVRPEIDQRLAAMKGLRRILLPLDGAPSSAEVIGPALNLAEQSGAEVDILYVATGAERPIERGTLTTPRYMDQPHYEWPTWAREFTSRFCTCLGKRLTPTPTRLFLRSGEPAAEILRFAAERDSDLIVLEWRGRLDPAHAKVVRGVLVDALCPVLLLRATPSPVR